MSKTKKKSTPKNNSSGSVAGKPVFMTWLPIIGIVMIAIVGFLAWRSFQSGGSSESAVPLSSTVGTQVGEIAPDFTVPTLDGGTFTLADQRGKPTVIYFMAYWCGTCIPEAQALARLQDENGGKLSIVVIDVDPSSSPDALTNFKQAANNGDYSWAFDEGQQVTNAYQVQALDTTFVLDAEGHVIYRDAYPTTYSILRDALQDAGI